MMDEELIDQPSGIPDYAQLKGMVRRRRWHFMLPFFAGWLAIWIASWFLPSVYRSGTLILIEQPAVPEKYVVSNIDSDIQQQMDSISQQILSRTRLLHVIQTLDLYTKERKGHTDDEVVDIMRKDVEIELSRGDDRKLSAFNIYYMNRDPMLAQAATRELANQFITENLEQRQGRSSNTTKFLQEQLDQARAKLAEQEARVREFKDKHLGELPSQTQSNLQILGGLQGQLQAQEDSLNRAKQQNTYLESLLNQYHALDHGSKGAVGGPSRLVAIDQELERLRAQLADLSSRYTDIHPDVRKAREQIAQAEKTRERIVAEGNRGGSAPSDGAVQAPPVDFRSAPVLELESQLKANRAEIASRQTEIKDFQLKVGEYQGRLNRAPVMEQQFADITRDYDQSKANYDSLLAKKNQSEMATDLEKTQQGEHFRMLDPPNLPTRPDKPNRLRLCLLGVLGGIVLGGLVAGGSEVIGGKVYSEQEIKKLVPFEVLVEVPPLETADDQVAARRSHLVAGATAAGILVCMLMGTAISYLHG
jgi:polysaccharide chain length determinant protein (PEP-CTERM system associated)